MTESLRQLSVVIPFLGNDYAWKDLFQDLRPLPLGAEILLVGPDEPPADLLARSRESLVADVRFVRSPRGRGVQLNSGAKAANRNFFWFLHADSKVPRPTLFQLGQALAAHPDVLHFFDLKFLDDGPKAMALNSIAANWRSQFLGMPFGDQGFAISRAQFYRVGGFAEDARYGEDHRFIWQARRRRVSIERIQAPIFTSARRYQTEGWARLTSRRLYLTYHQAMGELLKLAKQRLLESVKD